MISKGDIIEAGRQARSKPPIVLGACDYIVDEFSKELSKIGDFDQSQVERYPVNVIDDEGNRYNDGHTIARIDGTRFSGVNTPYVYVDLSLDQFCEQNRDKLGISFGSKDSIEDVIIMNGQMYDFLNDVDRSSNYQQY